MNTCRGAWFQRISFLVFLNQCVTAVIQSGDDDERRLKRREKNRVAAQRSRKRQTQRADELHEVRSEKPGVNTYFLLV